MTPEQICDLADRQDHMSQVAPVLRAYAQLLDALESDTAYDPGPSSAVVAALTRIEEL